MENGQSTSELFENEKKEKKEKKKDNDDTVVTENVILESHNAARREHGVPEVSLSAELSNQAQTWAEKLAEKRHISYAEVPGIGENITFFPIDIKGKEVVEHWLKERVNYDFSKPGWQSSTNYFTQLIWKSTTEIGIGIQIAQEIQKLIVVVLYRPSGNGNREGEFVNNVLPLVSTNNSAD